MSKNLMQRRMALKALGGVGLGAAFGCGSTATSPSTASSSSAASGSTTSTNAACVVTPTETAGPFPSITSIVRSDIRESKTGTVLTLTIKVVTASAGCTAVPGANVEIWHVDASGNYSEYGSQTTQTYLRGIQTTNANGEVTFTTVYPGWYQGRATHIHAEVKVGGRSVKVTQIAFPESINNTVYASGVYASRGSNPMSNLSDGIFADSLSAELVTPQGSPSAGYTANFQIGV
ncbi:MAG: intradiol ring-cleavage dioxygenase [Vicinamibacteria bacterium]